MALLDGVIVKVVVGTGNKRLLEVSTVTETKIEKSNIGTGSFFASTQCPTSSLHKN